MKKRLLALCLAAALLLGMMPALTLSTNAAETVSTKQTQNVGAANIEADGTQVVTSSDTLVRLRYYNVNSATAIPTWGKRGGVEDFYLDHTKEILFEENISINAMSLPKTDGTITIDEDGVMSFSGAMLKLVDNDTNSIVYLLLYRNADGKFCVNVLKADKTVGTLVTSLTGAPAIALQVLWAVDGSVTVTIGEHSAKVANATITRDATATKGTYTNPTSNYDLVDADFIEWSLVYPLAEMQVANDVYGGDTFVGTQVLFYEFYVTHTEYLPTEMDSYFTEETLTADGALTEASWNHASFADLDGIETAVLVNKGVAYIALKSATAETATVRLGETVKEATFANGVAEVAFDNLALEGYDSVRTLTVDNSKANVTFAANVIDPVGTGTTLTAAICGSAATGGGQVKDNTTFYRFYGKGSSLIFQWFRAAGADFAIDRSKESKIHVNMIIQPGFFNTTKAAFLVNENNAKSYATDAPNIAFTLKDEETDTFIYPFITGGENSILHVGFFLNDQVSNEYVSLGVSNAGTAGVDPNSDLSQLYFVWNTDGSVTVMLGDEVKGTVANATWTANDAYAFNRAQNPAFSNNVDVAADFIYIGGYGLAVQAYYYGLDVTSVTYIDAIETTLAEDLADAIAELIDTSDLASVPTAIEHDYLGNVPLTWSDSEGLIANGIVKVPAEDTVTTLTAKVGEEIIWSGEATVKAAEPIMGMFTTNVNAAWNAVEFTAMAPAGSVAVLAENKNTVYVAVKTADASATVTLGGAEQTISVVDGMAVVTFENVALNTYGDARTLSVVTESGELTTKVIFNAKKISPAQEGTTLTADICGSAVTSAGQVKNNTTYFRLYGKGTGTIFLWYRAAGADFAIDRSKDSKIHVNMSIQSCFFNTTKFAANVNTNNALDTSTDAPYIRFTFKDEETDTFFYPYLTGGENGIVHVGFLLNDQTTNEYVSLGVSNAGVTAGDSTTDLSQLYFVWNTDGSITVMLGEEVKGTVENATWTANDAYNFNRAQNPAFDNNVDVAADFAYIVGYGLAGQAYYYGLDVTPITPAGISDIELHNNDTYSLDLGSDIGFNFSVAENPGATITVNAAGKETVYNASDLTATDGFYLIEANVAAAQMTENVSVKIVDAYGFVVFDRYTSVKNYAEKILNDSDAKDDALVNAMLAYGGAAQTYFEYKIDDLVSETAPSDALLSETAADYAATQSGAVDGITVKSATLRLEEKVVIRYYFNAASVDGMTFKCGDKVLTAEQKSEGVWYVDVEVNPQNMGTTYTVTVNDALTVNYSCMTYMTKYAADVNVGELLKAMYDYYQAAVAYLAN